MGQRKKRKRRVRNLDDGAVGINEDDDEEDDDDDDQDNEEDGL